VNQPVEISSPDHASNPNSPRVQTSPPEAEISASPRIQSSPSSRGSNFTRDESIFISARSFKSTRDCANFSSV
jgi:hypothetical protein